MTDTNHRDAVSWAIYNDDLNTMRWSKSHWFVGDPNLSAAGTKALCGATMPYIVDDTEGAGLPTCGTCRNRF
jgi:hypothetical protein